MSIATSQVFLVPGQRIRPGAGGAVMVSPVIENCVVIANDAQQAQIALAQNEPGFQPLGFTSLATFEEAVVKLRQALNGEANGWPLVIADGMPV